MLNIFKIISVLALIIISTGANAQCAGMAGGICLGTNGQPYNGYNGQGDYQPQHHWAPNWGAIAIDPDNNHYWYVRDYPSAEAATNRAVSACNKLEHTDKCEIVGRAYANVCVTYAWGITKEGQHTSLRTAETQQKADDLAIKACQKVEDVHDCVIDYHDCLPPKQID